MIYVILQSFIYVLHLIYVKFYRILYLEILWRHWDMNFFCNPYTKVIKYAFRGKLYSLCHVCDIYKKKHICCSPDVKSKSKHYIFFQHSSIIIIIFW